MASLIERTYHSTPAAYALPNGVLEHRRLETQHECLLKLMNGRIIHASLPPTITRALDIGCGTGPVAHSLATARPTTTVYGLDLSPVPPLRTQPPNLEFIQGDFKELVRPDGTSSDQLPDPRLAPASFDLVFSRLLIFGITEWQRYIDAVAALLAPGGHAELHDACHPDPLPDLQPDTAADPTRYNPPWTRALNAAMRAKAMDPACGANIATYMRRAGLIDVHARRYAWPHDVWEGLPAEAEMLGRYTEEVRAEFYGRVIRRLGAELEEVGELESGNEGGKRVWFWLWVVVGRKPGGMGG
ncbi:S-adenosyl-L-methionine-dependent methyltransferase [Cenococcum geophilum 1.58]|uniref:S-adenosyl-L-methionine-dependent methyltransferase n=1 Tax=Cenococcum geophilum 1.58 TaxID=794803 RepID=UPI00358FF838|nr:S-adenosyl-L-methionine-dependent methyltransferase [Cenococcum geophilum 1.58]